MFRKIESAIKSARQAAIPAVRFLGINSIPICAERKFNLN